MSSSHRRQRRCRLLYSPSPFPAHRHLIARLHFRSRPRQTPTRKCLRLFCCLNLGTGGQQVAANFKDYPFTKCGQARNDISLTPQGPIMKFTFSEMGDWAMILSTLCRMTIGKLTLIRCFTEPLLRSTASKPAYTPCPACSEVSIAALSRLQP